jgi:hypothetical protein
MLSCSFDPLVISNFMFQNNNKEEQISMTLCGISSLVVTYGNMIATQCKHFNASFDSDNCRLLFQPSFIDMDNDFLHYIFESLIIHI